MVPPLLFDISDIDLDSVQYTVEDIEKVNPHRGAMRLLDGIIWCKDEPVVQCVAFKDVGHDEFWIPGHIPGRPLFPGVLMIEAGAQLASFNTLRLCKAEFMGFTGAENIKFRGQVQPGDRFILLGQAVKIHPRRSICDIQGLVGGKIVFEGRIHGMIF